MELTPAIADTILLTIEEGVTIYDNNFRLIAWNEKYVEMGITPPEHIREGLHIEDTYRLASELGVFGKGDPKEIASKRIQQCYAGDSPKVEDLCGSDGKTIEIRRYFLPDIGVAAVFSDVTESRIVAEKLKREEELEVLARLTGGFAHDFNNVLQVIEANLQVARITNDMQHIESASEAATSGAELARSMLHIARPSAFRLESDNEFEVVAVVEKTIRWIGRVLPDNVTVTTKFGIEASFLRGSESWFSNALVNLIMNSRDAMPGGGEICIDVESLSQNRLRVSVIDSGHGIADDIVNNINEPFFTTKGNSGTGLGLYEVKRFVDSLGGRFFLSSTPGAGTTASIVFTGVQSKCSAAASNSMVPASLNAPLRILLVEDDSAVQESSLRFLRALGARTTGVNSGEDAVFLLDGLKGKFFDALICDISLEGRTDGITVAQNARRRFPEMPIVLCTGSNSEVPSAQVPTGCLILRKPWKATTLVNHLNQVVPVCKAS